MRRLTFRDFELDEPNRRRKACKFWLRGGGCNSNDAPKQGISRCIGTRHCNNWEWERGKG